jgi:hypothetical protein
MVVDLMRMRQRGANMQGLAVELAPDASAKTRDAAKALHDELKSAQLMLWSDDLRPLPNVPWPSGDDSSTIILTVGNK